MHDARVSTDHGLSTFLDAKLLSHRRLNQAATMQPFDDRHVLPAESAEGVIMFGSNESACGEEVREVVQSDSLREAASALWGEGFWGREQPAQDHVIRSAKADDR